MSTSSLEDRVSVLEMELAQIKARIGEQSSQAEAKSGWERIYGSFANDPIYDEAMRLGRAYRESLRPKPRRPRKRASRRLTRTTAGKRRKA